VFAVILAPMPTLESNATQPWLILNKVRTGKLLTADYADNTDGKR
jgi:hypothetical protein